MSQFLLSRIYMRPFLLLTPSHQWGGRGCAGSWERTQPGQTWPQRDVPDHMDHAQHIYWEEGGGCLQWWCLSSQDNIMCDRTSLSSWRCWRPACHSMWGMNSLFCFACFTSSNAIVSTHEFSHFSDSLADLSRGQWASGSVGLTELIPNQSFWAPKLSQPKPAQPLSRFSQGKSGKIFLELACFAALPGGCFLPHTFFLLSMICCHRFSHKKKQLLVRLFFGQSQACCSVAPLMSVLQDSLRFLLYFPCCSAHFRYSPSCCSPVSVSLVLWKVLLSLAVECTLMLCPSGKNRGMEMEFFIPLPLFSSLLCKAKRENAIWLFKLLA